jgi:hypothetical protein
MDKITEEVLTSLIQRVETNEEEIRKLKMLVPTKKQDVGTYEHKKGMITPGQINFIKGLGGDPWPDMTSKEASEYIDKLKAQKDSHLRKQNESSAVGSDIQNGVLDKPGETGPKLTEEEIAELEEEGAFL